MNKNHKKWLIIAGAAVTGILATGTSFVAVTKNMVKIALDRDPTPPKRIQKMSKRISGSAQEAGFVRTMAQAALKLKKTDCETIEIESYDGTKLIGHWISCENPRRIIIAMHGWRSSWAKDFGSISDFWHENDCCVLYAEQRGQGDSGGDHMGFGLVERYDCLEWAKWINRHKRNDLPIYLCGVSMGAATVLMASSLPMPKNVCGIAADCGFTSPHDIWKHVAENNLHLSYGIIGNIANDICRKKIQVGTKDYSTLKALSETQIPILFIHGTDDTFVPIEMTYKNYKACTSQKRLFVVPGAGHAMSYFIDKNGYEKIFRDFWNEFDGNVPKLLPAHKQDAD